LFNSNWVCFFIQCLLSQSADEKGNVTPSLLFESPSTYGAASNIKGGAISTYPFAPAHQTNQPFLVIFGYLTYHNINPRLTTYSQP
jgi:hypothetical protein